ncbi:MAG: sugar transferase [Candidatus Acidiferrales bacterium]
MTKKETAIESKRWRAGEQQPRAEGFYPRYGKRIFDCASAAAGLMVLSPVLLGVSAAVASASLASAEPGPVFFFQRRVGKNGRPFSLIKFRTMAAAPDGGEASITVAGDARITPLGALLRRWKIDELPQLWNVWKGDLSLVGPRPELEDFVADYTLEQRRVLRVRPGITDLASIAYRDEAEMLAEHANPQEWYRRVVLPHKLALNLDYIESISFSGDVALILKTLGAVFLGRGERAGHAGQVSPGGQARQSGPARASGILSGSAK